LPKVTAREMQCLTRDQAKAFLKAATEDRQFARYAVALDAGCRPGELFALHWPDVDFETGSIFIRWSLEEIAGKCRLKKPKTTASRRRILLAPRTLAAVNVHRAAMLAEGMDLKDGLVFCDVMGSFLRLPNVRERSFLPIVKRAGLPSIRLYDLRHTVATLLLAAVVNVKGLSCDTKTRPQPPSRSPTRKRRRGREDLAVAAKRHRLAAAAVVIIREPAGQRHDNGSDHELSCDGHKWEHRAHKAAGPAKKFGWPNENLAPSLITGFPSFAGAATGQAGSTRPAPEDRRSG